MFFVVLVDEGREDPKTTKEGRQLHLMALVGLEGLVRKKSEF